MLLKSVIQNKKLQKILMYTLFLISLLGFVLQIIRHQSDFWIQELGYVNSDVVINAEVPNINEADFILYGDNDKIYEDKHFGPNNTYRIFRDVNSSTKRFYFTLNNKDDIKNVKNIVISLNNKFYYYTNDDIQKFERGQNGEYYLPEEIKYFKNSKYKGDKGLIHKISIDILSIFYNSKYFVFPIILLVVSGILFIINRDNISPLLKLPDTLPILLIMLFGAFLRYRNLDYPFSHDEICTLFFSEDLKSTLWDPGNPPFFYLMVLVWRHISDIGEYLCRLLPYFLSVLTIPMIYIFVKRNVNKNVALLASFLLSVNYLSVYSASELRCYSTGAFLTVLISYYLFEIIKYKKNKDFIIYAILTISMVNLHYFTILILFNLFILALVLLDNKSRIKFILSNLTGVISFIPFYMETFREYIVAPYFDWYILPDFDEMVLNFSSYFGSYLVAFIVLNIVLLLLNNKIRNEFFNENKNIRYMIFYSFYIILSLFITSYIFSFVVKPCIKTYYYFHIIGFVGIIISCCMYLPFKNKITKYLINLIFVLMYIFSVFNCRLFALGNGTFALRWDLTRKYAYYDQPQFRDKNVTIVLSYTTRGNKYYEKYLRGNEEILTYWLLKEQSIEIKDLLLSKSHNNLIYFMGAEETDAFDEKFEKSLLMSDNGVIFSRLVEK